MDKILALDFDWTIIKPKEGRTFPKDKDDWQWLRPNVPGIIKEYYNNGFKIYIVTNQTKEWKRIMIQNVVDELTSNNILNIEVIIGFGPSKDPSTIRKPNPLLFTNGKKTIKFDKDLSIFVGDAAGRVDDFSNSDKIFAENIEMTFAIPEDIFPIDMTRLQVQMQDAHRENTEIVILVGYPASGKSTWATTKLEPYGYNIISGDELKTLPKMIKAARIFLERGESVVFDATNPKPENREKIIALARQYDVSARCIVFDVSIEDAMMWNKHRLNETGKKVPNIAFYTFRKNYVMPINECEVLHV